MCQYNYTNSLLIYRMYQSLEETLCGDNKHHSKDIEIYTSRQ